MSDISQLRRLKDEYEHLRDQYLITRQLRHYTLFQEALRAYISYIDTHRISARSITDSLHMDGNLFDEEKTSFGKKIPLPAPETSSSEQLRYKRVSPNDVGKRILDFFEARPDYHTSADLMSQNSLRETQIRKALPILVQDGLLEKTKIQGTFYWCKSGQEPDNVEILAKKRSETEETLLRILEEQTDAITTETLCRSTSWHLGYVRRYLNKLFQDGLIEKTEIKQKYFWRKKKGI